MEQSEDVHISPAFEQLSAEAISRLDEPSTSEEKPTCAKRKSSFDMSSVSTTGKRQRDRALKSVSMDTDDEFMDDSTSEDAAEVTPWVEQFESMSRSCQKSALFALIGSLGLQHVRQLRHLIEPHFQKDFLTHLPMEIALQLVSCLPPADIVRAASVSRFWRLVCEDDRLWRIKCNEKKLDRTLLHQTPTTRVQGAWESTALASGVVVMDHVMGPDLLRLKQEREVKHGPVFTRSKWKSLFLRYCRIQANWRSRPIGGSCILRGHDEHVITCLQINDDMIVTGSDDNTLKVWCISKGCLLFSLVGHSGGVWTSQLSTDGRFIVSGSTDRTVKVWSATDGQGTLLRTLVGHTSTVRCMSLHGNILVSGSRDTTLRAWCIESGRCLQQLLGHQAAVRCVQFDGTRVVSGAYDFSVKVWDLESGKCYYTLHGHSNRVYSLLLDAERNLVVSGSLDTSIRVWDISTGTCICVLNGHTSLTSGMQLRGDILVSCNADSTVRVWNIRTGTCVHRLHGQNGHSSAITSLQYMENGLVATSSDDGTVKLWDVDKGIFLRDLIRLNSGGNGGCIWRLKATENLLACAVGSRNGTEDTKLILVDFDSSFA